ncbi:3-dehydroquinate synthase [Leptospira vanthielii]|uniref:3-dehydroquinate synthase n=1 Tax=Leptospira vanthielii serovar Holland str. Waz Holland = ATCC 700522 TaxID=1218591 RepID=N1W3Z5_9LEPT|nr:3-dehydroquinate synthase [Leptospira vanthielii]EMY70964.1 3-dehydroquinate synthase [Leptospira vanthielii serovar Holland str. Waz Holland = ATCC 700522]
MKLSEREIIGQGFRYPIELHEDFQGLSEKLNSLPKVSKVYVLTSREIAGIYEKYITKELNSLNVPFSFIYLKPGEKNKHIDRVKKVYNQLIETDADRKAVVIAFGGGVVGDFAGFIAATYQRGVRFVQVPTTLLACVDSSVGGKVAVNVDSGKNMVGAFYQPEFVFAPLFTLSTLPEKEWSCGLAEIVKHAFLDGGDFLDKISKTKRSDFSANSPTLRYAIEESVRVKSGIVSQDEKETGLRAVLNLGHTTGHAIESLTQYKKYSHGEAVAVGLVTALLLSRELVGFSESNFQKAITLMKQLELPTRLGEKPDEILKHMEHDKKKEGTSLKFVLLEDFGKPKFGVSVDRKTIFEILKRQKGKL